MKLKEVKVIILIVSLFVLCSYSINSYGVIKQIPKSIYKVKKATETIVSVDSVEDISILQGQKYKLPVVSIANMSNGTAKTVRIIWNLPNIDTNVCGNYTVYGKVSGYSDKVECNLCIKPYIKSISDIYEEANLGQKYNLPVSVGAVTKDNKDQIMSVTWNSAADVSKVGEYTYIGKVDGYDKDVKLTLNVIDRFALNYTGESKHFIFKYTFISKKCINDLTEVLEGNYDRITKDLNVGNMPKIIVSIYPDVKIYHEAINRPNDPDSSIGNAIYDHEIKMASPLNQGQFDSYKGLINVIIHEFTHLVEESKAPNHGNLKRWINESVAVYEADQKEEYYIKDLIQKNYYPSIEELNAPFGTDVYGVGYSLIDYIDATYGMDKVNDLILNDGDIRKVLNMTNDEFMGKWFEFIKLKYK